MIQVFWDVIHLRVSGSWHVKWKYWTGTWPLKMKILTFL